MKYLLLVVLSAMMLCMASCSSEVIVDNPSLELSSSMVERGDEIILTFDPGERTNVNFNLVEFYWEDEKIGEVKSKPYTMRYIIKDIEKGLYIVKCNASYEKRKGTSTMKHSVGVAKLIEVQ